MYLLGFTKPGHIYWNQETLAAVEKRYGPLGFDITPYKKTEKFYYFLLNLYYIYDVSHFWTLLWKATG